MAGKKKEQAQATETQQTPPEAGVQSAPSTTAPANVEPKKEEAKALADASPKKAVEQATVGRIVHFHREVNSGNGVALLTLPAIVIGPAAKESNLPENSVDLGVHSRAGYETRFGVMFSDVPKAGHWSWPKR